MKSPRPDSLETWVDRTLRDLPDEPAPAALTSRVMDELARRAARPWWQRSPSTWPLALRLSVIVLPLLVAVLASPLPDALTTLQRQLDVVRVVATALQHAALALWQQVPALWLTVALGVLGFSVFASFGLGLIARRLLVPAR
jgi:hypothetical protein